MIMPSEKMIDYVPCIYTIKNTITNNVYVGSAFHLRRRLNKHMSELRANRHHSKHMQNAYNKYGADAFVLDSVLYMVNKEDLLGVEEFVINMFHACDPLFGYNTCKTGNNRSGIKHTEETKRKMSESRRKNPPKIRKWKCKKDDPMSRVYTSREKGGKAIKCIENGKIYLTGIDAAIDLKISRSSVGRYLKNTVKHDNRPHLIFVEDSEIEGLNLSFIKENT